MRDGGEWGTAARGLRTQQLSGFKGNGTGNLARNVQAGIVWINDHHRVDAASPWGGVKLSGIGREFGEEAFNAYFSTKAVMVNTSGAPFDWYDPAALDARLN